MNRKVIVMSLAAAFSAHFSSVAMAASIDGNATATVIEPLSITEDVVLDFGTVSGGPAPGTVTISPAGARSTTGDAQVIGTDGNAGQFTIDGEGGQAYTLSFVGTATLENAAGDTMTADNFTDTSTGTIPGGPGASSETFNVGARLNLGADQNSGDYTTIGRGSPFTVTVNYD